MNSADAVHARAFTVLNLKKIIMGRHGGARKKF